MPCRSKMGPRLSVIGVCLLPLLTAFATDVSYGTTQYSSNATNLVSSEDLESPFPYYFPNQINTDNLFPMPRCNGVILEEATVDQLQDAMSKGHLTSTKIAKCYMQRIQQTNQYIKYEQKFSLLNIRSIVAKKMFSHGIHVQDPYSIFPAIQTKLFLGHCPLI